MSFFNITNMAVIAFLSLGVVRQHIPTNSIWDAPYIVGIGSDDEHISIAVYSNRIKVFCFGQMMQKGFIDERGFTKYKIDCDVGTAAIGIKQLPDSTWLIDEYSHYILSKSKNHGPAACLLQN